LSNGLRAAVASALPPKIAVRVIAAYHYLLGEPELRHLRQIADPAKESIDAGAHHGAYTYFLARDTKWVHCYEPYPRDAQFLAEAFAGRNVTVHPLALSDREGSGELHVPLDALGQTGGQPSLLPPRGGEAPQTRLTVTTKRLDHMGHADIGFIKIDVEGHERSVVAGASGLIEEQRPVLLVELHGYSEEDPALLLREITAPGYVGWFWDSRGWLELERFRVGVHAKQESAGARGLCCRKNFVFIPAERLTEKLGVRGQGSRIA
jgi:FkbM family methyltransferase